MTAESDLVAAAKKRLGDLEEEKLELLAVLSRHGATGPSPIVENGRRAAKRQGKKATSKKPAPATPPRRGLLPSTKPKVLTIAQQRGAVAFEKMEDGPTETLMAILKRHPDGMTYSEAVQGALKTVRTNATNKERSVGNVLLSLKKRKKVAYHDSKYYAPF